MHVNPERIELLEQIQQRVLWLSTKMIDIANNHRNTADGLKVGGHQASCASMVTLMTALYLQHLRPEDFVAVKPHGAPVLHAINYLLGGLDRSYLDQLRRFGGLQAYPSRTKDPDRVDFSTGSVGLGPAATIFAANVRRYVDAHFGARPASRFVAVLGDAELDEGNIWEAVHDPETHMLGQVTWLVDFNRQSLDRVVPDMRISPWRSAFQAHGWHVMEIKFGRRLQAAFAEPGGELLHAWIDVMPNEQYQSLFSLHGAAARERFLEGAPEEVGALLAHLSDDEFVSLVTDLGGHDMVSVLEALAEADRHHDRPTVIFAYTHKGWGLPTQGSPRNHAAILNDDQVEALRVRAGIPADDPWPGFDPDSPAGRLLAERAALINRPFAAEAPPIPVPTTTDPRSTGQLSTQEGFGRILVSLSRNADVAPYLVTTAPDVATSTNLAGWINRMGVFTSSQRREWMLDPLLSWREGPTGQHIELGIAEMNLFLLLGQLGLGQAYSGQRLLPVGTVYDPFVCRGLDAFIYAVYSGASFVVAGTPSGVTLAPEGGAHQSTITASIGIELPGVTLDEPAYVGELDWLLCDALARVGASDGRHSDSTYLRLSTRTIDQAPFTAALARYGAASLRRQVLEGAYVLVPSELPPGDGPAVTLVATGAVMPEAIAAARELAGEGIGVSLVNVTSPGRLHRVWQQAIRTGIRGARTPDLPGVLRACFGSPTPIVTIHDASSHAMAWLGGALSVASASVGVDEFGQSGSVGSLYAAHDLAPGAIVNAALGTLSL